MDESLFQRGWDPLGEGQWVQPQRHEATRQQIDAGASAQLPRRGPRENELYQTPIDEIRGKVNGGVVVLDDPHPLPDGAFVRIEPVVEQLREEPAARTVWDALLEWAGCAKGLPPDQAEQHDHYLYGTPKR